MGLKRLAIGGNLVMVLIVFLMSLAPRVSILRAIVAVKGMVAGTFWPQIMGWISTGTEGGALNRRLGFFNLSLVLGLYSGHLAGGSALRRGVLAALHHRGLRLGPGRPVHSFCPQPERARRGNSRGGPDGGTRAELEVFRWICRFALFFGWIGCGVLRVVIASLIKEMSLGAGLHATIGATMNLIMLVCFFLLGRWVIWHYRFWPLLLAQVAFAFLLVGVGASRTSTHS